METFLYGLSAYLILNVLLGLERLVRGPRRSDRMLAAQLFGTAGVATLLVLASVLRLPGLRDTALVFAVLATVTTAVLVSQGAPPQEKKR